LNKELLDAISAQDEKLFWSVLGVLIVTALINYLFNIRLAESIKRRSEAESKIHASKIKIPEKTNLLQLEKRIETIEKIAELQRVLQEWIYDHQALQTPYAENHEQNKKIFDDRWLELNKVFREIGVHFVVNNSPYLHKYQKDWGNLANTLQEFFDIFLTAKVNCKSGGSGNYTFDPKPILKSADSLKQRIFDDASDYE